MSGALRWRVTMTVHRILPQRKKCTSLASNIQTYIYFTSVKDITAVDLSRDQKKKAKRKGHAADALPPVAAG